MRHPWDTDDYPRPLWGHRSHAEAPARAERIWMLLLLLGLFLMAGLDGIK